MSGISGGNPDWSNVKNKPTYFPSRISDVDMLQATLDGKADMGHTHAIADVTDLQTALDGKAALSHTHVIADTTGLQTALNAKIASTEKGANNGVATLDGSGKLTSSQLPTGAGLPSRQTATITTGSLASNASVATTITMAKSARILSVELDRAARATFCATTAIRDADLGRSVLTDPANGVWLDVVSTGAQTVIISGYGAGHVSSMEASPTTSIPVNIYNLSGGASTVTLTVVYLQQEA